MLYGFESLGSLQELFGQEEEHVLDKWDSVPSTAHSRSLKIADKGGWRGKWRKQQGPWR